MQAQLLQADIKIKPNQLSCQCRQLTWSALGLFGDALDGVALPAVDLHTLAHNTKAASAHHAPDKEQAVQLVGVPDGQLCVGMSTCLPHALIGIHCLLFLFLLISAFV
eukprot:scaffold99910_cov16-Tisochrysis_lutea.AAC.2